MRKLQRVLTMMLLLSSPAAFCQKLIDSAAFFKDETPFELTLASDFKGLINKKMTKTPQPAIATLKFADSTVLQEEITIGTRGKFRLENCFMPPLRLNFKTPGSQSLYPLGKVKLVVGCETSNEDEQLIIKEFLSYKIYNMLTEKSFRVRLAKINYQDTKGKIKPYSQYGFMLEDVDDMAARNKCKEVEKIRYETEMTDRKQMTIVALFEYMMGNTDWSVPAYHNIKLMQSKAEPGSVPFAVPYDLNHTGFVNASYAAPPEELQLSSVRERLYRGFARTMEELDEAIAIYKREKENIFALISNCPYLNNKYKKETTNYLQEFYKTIENRNSVKYTFIDNARAQ